MNRKTIFVGIGLLVLLLAVGIAAAAMEAESEDMLPDFIKGKDGCGGRGGYGMGRGHGMNGMPGFAAEADLDGDGIPNCEDPDDDADGINDTVDQYPHDHDNDGIPDHRDDDDDNDGISDAEDDYYVGNTPERRGRPGRMMMRGFGGCRSGGMRGGGRSG